MENWEMVFATDDPVKIEMVRAVLETHAINAVILNKRDSSFNNWGNRELYVEKEQSERAKKIIDDEVQIA